MVLHLDDAAETLKDRSANTTSFFTWNGILVFRWVTIDGGQHISYRIVCEELHEEDISGVDVIVTGENDIARLDALEGDDTEALRTLYYELVVRALRADPSKYGLLMSSVVSQARRVGMENARREMRSALGLDEGLNE